MASAFIQSKAADGTAQALNITYNGAVASGSLLVTSSHSWGPAVVAVTDDVNGAWTEATNSLNSDSRQQILYFPNSGSGATTVTSTGSGNPDRSMVIAEFSGVKTSAALDGTNTGSGSGTAMSSGSVTPGATSLYIGGWGNQGNNEQNFSSPTALTTLVTDQIISNNLAPNAMTYIVASSGAKNAGLTNHGGGVWAASIAAFNDAAVGGVAPTSVILGPLVGPLGGPI